MSSPKKSLGQHWLNDKSALNAVIDAADINDEDVVLEVGPGLGTLTEILAVRAKRVIAVEVDKALADSLEMFSKTRPWKNKLEVVKQDILEFDLTTLPPNYKVVANIPYYLTSNLLRVLSESPNPPTVMSLLVQKEVAQRIAASPGHMSILSVSVQLYYQPKLHEIIPAELFTPPPKIDSQIVSLKRHSQPLFDEFESSKFFQIVKAGFAGRRKKLRSSLAAGLHMEKNIVDEVLMAEGISGDQRAQELTIYDWYRLSTNKNL
jgi:16S rRNA (adenine1518-N6/adenine1519-N6)-dimethyltransferase